MAKRRKGVFYLTPEEWLRYGGSLTMTDQERLLIFIWINKEVTQSDVYCLFNGRVGAKQLHSWLKRMFDRGSISMRSAPSRGGRPIIWWGAEPENIDHGETPEEVAIRRRRMHEQVKTGQCDGVPSLPLPPHPDAEKIWAEFLNNYPDWVKVNLMDALAILRKEDASAMSRQAEEVPG